MDSDYVMFTCILRHKFQSIYFLVKGQWLEMHPEDYIIRHLTITGEVCVIGIHASDNDFVLLGQSFFRGYYSIFDMDHNRIGFAPHSTSVKSKV